MTSSSWATQPDNTKCGVALIAATSIRTAELKSVLPFQSRWTYDLEQLGDAAG
ncbi:hypothetical protein JF544_10960 [Halobacillus kuroshimensis]|uniref:Uncharacterized protein n=1 Tax=Halobacillus kuroshimensis TaxID=302481 RepID=A0ABS3DWQ9_9BACI|nr:hypothetical protein [Halobacillus kuroshimensis]MBN8235771.1 hypothetical protein [Halobacillus kuroshimensis]